MAKFNISSSKYKDIISKSILISSGLPPAVYLLKSMEQKIGKLTRKTVGERNLDKMNKTILLVGETGAGKSTLINTLVNYTMGVKFEDNIWFEIVKEEKKSQSESQTSDEKTSQSGSQTPDEKKSQSESQTSDEKKSQSGSQTPDEKKSQSESQTSDERKSQSESQTSDEKTSQSESQTSDERKSQSESQTSDEKKSQSESQTSDEKKSQSESGTSDEKKRQPESQTPDEMKSQSESQTSDEKKSQSGSQTPDEKTSQSESQTSDEKKRQSESQTPDVIIYEIFGFEGQTLPFSLTIIDTPGFGNTSGIEHDVNINEQLLDLFLSEDGVYEIDAVGLVVKSSMNQLTDTMKYVFDSVTSLFGKDMEKNIVPLMTFSNGVTPTNALTALEDAQIKCATNEKNQPVYFQFDNCHKDQRTEEDEFALENAWRLTERGMKRFTDFLERSEPQQLKTTLEVLKSRIRLTACIQNLQERIKTTEQKQNEIKQIKEVLRKHEQEMDKHKEFTVEFDEVKKVKERIDHWWDTKAVTCNICKENCHHPGCTWAWKVSNCEVMKDGRCTSCTGKCPAKDHVKENWKYVARTNKVKKTLHELKQKYKENKTESEKEKNILTNLQTEMEDLEAEKNQLLDETYQHVEKLQSIALNVDSLSTYVHLDFLIEKMKERGDTEKVQKLEEMRKRGDEGIKSVLRYMYGKLTGAGKTDK